MTYEIYEKMQYCLKDPWCCPALRPEIHVPVPFKGVTDGWMPYPDEPYPVWYNMRGRDG